MNAEELKSALAAEYERNHVPCTTVYIEFTGETSIDIGVICAGLQGAVIDLPAGPVRLSQFIEPAPSGHLKTWGEGEGVRPFEGNGCTITLNLSDLKLASVAAPASVQAPTISPDKPSPARSGWPNIMLGAWLFLVGTIFWKCAR